MALPALRARLREGRPLLAVFSIIPAPEVVEIVALAGFEAVILDLEHGAHQSESLAPLILAARARNIYPLVRVRSSEPTSIGAALDAGAAGIIVPQIGSADEARRAVAAARFAPDGNRGANSYVRAADYSGRAEWFAEANRDVAVLLMVEGAGAVAELPQIIETPNLDGIFIGPLDLSHALGVPGDVLNPRVTATIESIVDACRAQGTTTGIFAASTDAAKRWIGRGVTLVALGVDTNLFLRALQGVVAEISPAPPPG